MSESGDAAESAELVSSAMDHDGYHYDSAESSGGPPTVDQEPRPAVTKHTQFLDLTNGEGGELEQHSQEVLDDDDMLAGTVTASMASNTGKLGGGGGAMSVGAARVARHRAGGGGGSLLGVVDPNTPGKVVESGQEHTGRWTKEEHEAFLLALKMYGKEWKKVAAKVKTRTVVQTRTHAQKYFQKLHKAIESGKDDVTDVEMGVAAEARKASSSTPSATSAQKKQKQQQRQASSIASTSKVHRQTSLTSAAHLISNLSSSSEGLVVSQSSSNALSSSSGHPPGILKQPQQSLIQQSNLDHQPQQSLIQHASTDQQQFQEQPAPRPLPSGGQSFPGTATHGFSTAAVTELPTSSYTTTSYTASSGGSRFLNAAAAVTDGSGGSRLFSMKIVAPEHDVAMKRGKFPEPSPAACGKRKLAEIAAARMLAGVAASSTGSGNIGSELRAIEQQRRIGVGRNHSEFAEHDPDGTATPPPVESGDDNGNAVTEKDHRPAPPTGNQSDHQFYNGTSGDLVGSSSIKKPALLLQIVNPDTLGVTYDHHKRRRGDDGSPVTPWEGDIKALVSESKNNKTSPPKAEGADLLPKLPTMDLTSGPAATNPFLHPVCGASGGFGRSSLHEAICEMEVETIKSELTTTASSDGVVSSLAGISKSNGDSVAAKLQKADDAGFRPLHLACCLCTEDAVNQEIKAKPVEIVRLLLLAGADVGILDSKGNTPLHWAARCGCKSVAELLLLKNSPRDAKNDRGESPLHWAMRAGRVGMKVVDILLENGARPSTLSNEFKRAIDVAADGFHDEEGSVVELKKLAGQRKRLSKENRKILKAAAEERREARANLLRSSAQSRTLVLHHPECLEHIPKSSSDWEAPGRVTTIMDRLKSSKVDPQIAHIFDHEVCVSQEFDRAKLDLLSRVHSTEYLSFVNDLSKDLERQQKAINGDTSTASEESGKFQKGTPPVVPFTPMVQRSMIKIAESSVKEGQHSDTSFSAGSLRAARRAAGAVQHAVDCVLVGRNRNAFCVVRPPGHHAGINGLLDGGESCGFCIFNNVAAGAMHAISDERLLCERCAIVDIDVHHGNGTEEIVRKCQDPGKLFFFSIHLYDNERKGKRETKAFHYKFYPGTGDEDNVALNIINVPITPLWKEKEHSTPANIHNTRNRARQRHTQDKDSADWDSSENGTPKASDAEMEQPPNKGHTSSGTSSPTVANPSASTAGRLAYRAAIRSRLLPALRAFNPDLILISAGFDASRGDVGNAKHEHGGKEKMGIDLDPEDYAWTTRKILEIADICCQGRVVSVLEGGYGRTPQASSSTKKDEPVPLDKTIFGECAMRHLHAMIDPYDVEGRIRSSSSSYES